VLNSLAPLGVRAFRPSDERTILNACEDLLQSITTKELAKLTRFAERRLTHFGANIEDANDLFQQAIYAILHGINGRGGRIPRPTDLANRDAFQNYLRGAISSIAEGWSRIHHRVAKRTSSLTTLEPVLFGSANTGDNVEFADLIAQLFSQLRKRAQPHLLPTIDAWEKAPDGCIPCVTSHKHVYCVRRLAQQIAVRLELGTSPSAERRRSSSKRAQKLNTR
jgi:hypothetical protein